MKTNGEIIRGLYEAVNNKDLDYIRSLGASFSEWLDVPFNYTTYGESAIVDPWASWFVIFPDASCEVKSLVELGDHVIAQGIGRGTHKGDFNSPAGLLKPSGVAMQVNFCDVYRLRDGKIERADSYFDFYGLLMQLKTIEVTKAYIGMWMTSDGQIRHELLPGDRYNEGRGKRNNAYQGNYKVTGNHIEYVDDTGFTADGDFKDGILYHAGMVLYKQETLS